MPAPISVLGDAAVADPVAVPGGYRRRAGFQRATLYSASAKKNPAITKIWATRSPEGRPS